MGRGGRSQRPPPSSPQWQGAVAPPAAAGNPCRRRTSWIGTSRVKHVATNTSFGGSCKDSLNGIGAGGEHAWFKPYTHPVPLGSRSKSRRVGLGSTAGPEYPKVN